MTDARNPYSITVPTQCPRCGSTSTASSVTQHCRAGAVVHSASLACHHCGFALESDDTDLPVELRRDFYREHGVWVVRLSVQPSRPVDTARVLASILGRTPAEALATVRRTPAILTAGTFAEAACIAETLRAAGLIVELERSGDAGTVDLHSSRGDGSR